MSENANKAAPAFPILGVLGIVFVTLKLCGVIDWSWWWVTAPFWAVPAFLLIVGLPLLAFYFIAKAMGR